MKIREFLLLTYILISCGPSAEQKAAMQRAKEDSIRAATRRQVEKIQALKDSLEDIVALKEGLENRLMVYRADLETANDKMSTIKEYQLLRSTAEREQQVRSQFLVIEGLENEIKKLGEEMDKYHEVSVRLKGELNELQSTL